MEKGAHFERFIGGASGLKKEELLTILLRTGTKGKSALKVGEEVVKKYNKKSLIDATYQEFKNILRR